jgi:protein TonB
MSDCGKQRTRDGIARSPLSPFVPHGPRRIAFAAAALFSAGLHAAAFLACLTWSKPTSLGAVELAMDVVSIELAPSPVLEAQPKAERQEPAPSTASVAPVEGNADADSMAERSREPPPPDEPKPEPPVDPPKVQATEPAATVPKEPQKAIADAEALPAGPVAEKEKPTVEPPADPEPREEVREAAKREPEKKAKKVEETEEEDEEEKPKRETRRTRKGGVTSRARSGKATGSSRASASAGSILSYAAYVRARVAGNKPAGAGHRGTASIAFGVTPSGGLAYARVSRSSGSAALDRLALGAVRQAAPFPRPPSGARPGQLRFSIAFHFR